MKPVSLPPRRAATILGLAVLTVAAFSPVFQAEFISLDDPAYVTSNPHVLQGLSLRGLSWAFTSFEASNWHPVTWISHMADISLFGLRAGAHHGTNLAIHTLSAILLLLALERLTGKLWPSFLIAALFAVHPLRVESVAWVSERKDVLAGLFGMLTLLAYLRYLRHPGSKGFPAVLVLFSLGLMAKPMLVTLPFVLLILDWWPLGRFHAASPSSARLLVGREKLPLLALSAASCLITYLAQQRGGGLVASDLFPPASRWGNALVSYVGYLGKTVWPHHLILFYPHPGSSLSREAIALSLLLLTCITLLALAGRRRHPWLIAGWLWYLGMLVPVLGLVQVGLQGMADRYSYLPGIGLLIACVGEASSIAVRRSRNRLVPAIGGGVLLIALALGARHQAAWWKDTVTLFDRVTTVDPQNYFGFNMLGAHRLMLGDAEAAVSLLTKALELRPEYYVARYNLALALTKAGRRDEAIAQFAAVIRFNPRDAESRHNRGMLLLDGGEAGEALKDFDAALALYPGEPRIHLLRGLALEKLQRPREAQQEYETSLRLDSGDAVAHNTLGSLLADEGRLKEALTHFEAAVRLAPGYPAAMTNLERARSGVR